MRGRRDQNEIIRRCDRLESLGFEIDHEDYRVCLGEKLDSGLNFRDFTIDFSAIAEDQFMAYAMNKVFEYGVKVGGNRVRQGIRDLLEPVEDD
jgi:hypothetical protein